MGGKTLNEIGSFNNVNNKLLVNELEKSLSDYLEKENFINEKETPNIKYQVKFSITNYLKSIKDRKAIDNYHVDSEYCHHGWKEIYPKLPTRIFAITTNFFQRRFNLFRNGEIFKWYHFILPFKIVDETNFLRDKMEEDWEDYLESLPANSIIKSHGHNDSDKLDWILENIEKYFIHDKWANLIIPWESLDVDLYIQPVRAIEYITINFTVDPPMTQKESDVILNKVRYKWPINIL